MALEGKIAFARPFLEDRVIGATATSYGEEATAAIRKFIVPIVMLHVLEDGGSVESDST